MNIQRGFSGLVGLLLLIILAGGGLFFYTEKFSKEMPEADIVSTSTQKEVAKENTVQDKGSFNSQEEQIKARTETLKNSYFEEKGLSFVLKSEYPDSQKYKLPITIKGAVTDETKWGVFEGEAGVVEIYGIVNGADKKIASTPIILPNFNYGTNRTDFNFDLIVGDRQWMSSLDNENGYLLFKEAGAKDDEKIDYIKVPILFDISNL